MGSQYFQFLLKMNVEKTSKGRTIYANATALWETVPWSGGHKWNPGVKKERHVRVGGRNLKQQVWLDDEGKMEESALILMEHLFWTRFFYIWYLIRSLQLPSKVCYSIVSVRKQKMRKVTSRLTYNLRPGVSNTKAPGHFTTGHFLGEG